MKREVVNFVIVFRVVSGPTAWAACAAGSSGLKPEGLAVEISDGGTTRFAVCHGKIPLAFEVLYLLIARSEAILSLLKCTFEGAVPLCEPCCIRAVSRKLGPGSIELTA